MKNLLLVMAQAGAALFALVGALSILNYAFGWRIGFKGSVVPPDPAIAAVFFVIAAALGFIVYRAGRSRPG
ncbi:MAG: hypothetical protein IPK81_12090 [Rhodospirillales bacterium]|nr:hypothetical protein [Rhodospirillales bacterium]QQS14818.1 MAG: hypothetical protein IPK81_12090 [Rhodospirillales bacterium]